MVWIWLGGCLRLFDGDDEGREPVDVPAEPVDRALAAVHAGSMLQFEAFVEVTADPGDTTSVDVALTPSE